MVMQRYIEVSILSPLYILVCVWHASVHLMVSY